MNKNKAIDKSFESSIRTWLRNWNTAKSTPPRQLRQKTTNSSRGKVLEENPDEFLHKFLFDVTDLDDSESNLFYLPQLSSEDNTNVHERANDTEQVLREEF